jgi:hypothetical protein
LKGYNSHDQCRIEAAEVYTIGNRQRNHRADSINDDRGSERQIPRLVHGLRGLHSKRRICDETMRKWLIEAVLWQK